MSIQIKRVHQEDASSIAAIITARRATYEDIRGRQPLHTTPAERKWLAEVNRRDLLEVTRNGNLRSWAD